MFLCFQRAPVWTRMSVQRALGEGSAKSSINAKKFTFQRAPCKTRNRYSTANQMFSRVPFHCVKQMFFTCSTPDLIPPTHSLAPHSLAHLLTVHQLPESFSLLALPSHQGSAGESGMSREISDFSKNHTREPSFSQKHRDPVFTFGGPGIWEQGRFRRL